MEKGSLKRFEKLKLLNFTHLLYAFAKWLLLSSLSLGTLQFRTLFYPFPKLMTLPKGLLYNGYLRLYLKMNTLYSECILFNGTITTVMLKASIESGFKNLRHS